MKPLFSVVAVAVAVINACGTETAQRTAAGDPKGGTVTTVCTTPTQTNCTVSSTTPVVSAPPVTGFASINSAPTHYTFMDTPFAAQCADAFIRSGNPLPDTTVARSLIINSAGGSGFAIQDLQTTTYPILNIVYAKSKFANVTLQFLNKNGFYCIIKNEACASTVNIQRSCTAQMTSIEPITVGNNAAPAHVFSFWDSLGSFFGSPTNTQAYGSTIVESPCIP